MLPYSLSPSPSLLGSRTKDSAQRKWRGERRTNTGRTVSPDMGIGENLIKEVAEDIGCIIINNYDIIDDSNEVACIESSGFSVPRPDNKYKGCFIAVIGGGGLINSGSAYGFKVLLAVCPAKCSDFFLFSCHFQLRRTRERLI